MGKRFQQFLLENEIIHHDIDNDTSIQDMLEILPANNSTMIIIAKFVLYCTEDVFEFNNDETRNAAKNCIDLIRKYINDPHSVTDEELINASNNAINISASYPIRTASSAARSIAIGSFVLCANTAYNAASAFLNYNNNNNNNIRIEKMNEYKRYLHMLISRFHPSNDDTLDKINQLTQNKPQTEDQWFAFLTNIIDENKVDNIIRARTDGRFEVDLPRINGQSYFPNIIANSTLELIDMISRNENIRELIYHWFKG